MSVPGSEALTHPTSFPRVDQIPTDFGQSNGVETDFGAGFGTGGQTTLYDNAKDSNTGFPAVNRPLTYTFLVDSSWSQLDTDHYFHESLVFTESPRRLGQAFTSSTQPRLKMLSLSAWNRFMRLPEQRREFGNCKHVSSVKVKWRFMGAVKRPQRPLVPEDAVPVVFGGRTRTPDIGRAYTPSGASSGGRKERLLRGIPGQLDCMYLVYRRYRYRDIRIAELRMQNGGVSSAQQNAVVDTEKDNDKYAWQADLYVNRTGQTPHSSMFCEEHSDTDDDNYTGDYERLGWIGFVFGDRTFCIDSAERARKVARGSRGYEKETPLLEAVELFLGTR